MLICNEGIAVKQVDMNRFGLESNVFTQTYPKKLSIMKIIKLPINFSECIDEEREQLFEFLFRDMLDYIGVNGYKMTGDVIGVKISLSLDGDTEEQHVLISMPIE